MSAPPLAAGGEQAGRHTDEALDRLGSWRWLARLPHEPAGGEQQRVTLSGSWCGGTARSLMRRQEGGTGTIREPLFATGANHALGPVGRPPNRGGTPAPAWQSHVALTDLQQVEDIHRREARFHVLLRTCGLPLLRGDRLGLYLVGGIRHLDLTHVLSLTPHSRV